MFLYLKHLTHDFKQFSWLFLIFLQFIKPRKLLKMDRGEGIHTSVAPKKKRFQTFTINLKNQHLTFEPAKQLLNVSKFFPLFCILWVKDKSREEF